LAFYMNDRDGKLPEWGSRMVRWKNEGDRMGQMDSVTLLRNIWVFSSIF
jgi:hypothetical protein